MLYTHLKYNPIKQEIDLLYNRFSDTYLQFLNSTTLEPTEEIYLRYLSLFLLSYGFWRCKNSSTSFLQSAQAWGLS